MRGPECTTLHDAQAHHALALPHQVQASRWTEYTPGDVPGLYVPGNPEVVRHAGAWRDTALRAAASLWRAAPRTLIVRPLATAALLQQLCDRRLPMVKSLTSLSLRLADERMLDPPPPDAELARSLMSLQALPSLTKLQLHQPRWLTVTLGAQQMRYLPMGLKELHLNLLPDEQLPALARLSGLSRLVVDDGDVVDGARVAGVVQQLPSLVEIVWSASHWPATRSHAITRPACPRRVINVRTLMVVGDASDAWADAPSDRTWRDCPDLVLLSRMPLLEFAMHRPSLWLAQAIASVTSLTALSLDGDQRDAIALPLLTNTASRLERLSLKLPFDNPQPQLDAVAAMSALRDLSLDKHCPLPPTAPLQLPSGLTKLTLANDLCRLSTLLPTLLPSLTCLDLRRSPVLRLPVDLASRYPSLTDITLPGHVDGMLPEQEAAVIDSVISPCQRLAVVRLEPNDFPAAVAPALARRRPHLTVMRGDKRVTVDG